MNSYTSFAYIYDRFMDNVPYAEWTEYITGLLAEENITEGIVADLGCGTGSVTELLALKGFDMIGIDSSEDMLQVALERRDVLMENHPEAQDILYLNQDMREFELYGTVAAVVSICDSMNYILEDDELLTVFELVHNYLDYNGIFIFDMNTPYKYANLLGDNTFAENREECSFIWENFYDEETSINEYDLTLFVAEDDAESNEENRRFIRYEEVHEQRAYEIDDVKNMLERAGLQVLHVYDAFTKDDPTPTSERVYFIARKNQE